MYGADLKILITFSILFCGNFLANAKNNLHKNMYTLYLNLHKIYTFILLFPGSLVHWVS